MAIRDDDEELGLKQNSKDAEKYSAANIKVLEGIEAIRKHPGMYIGDTEDGSGLRNLVYEVLDNAIDEAIGGYCDQITITFTKDGYIVVEDNGRGIPVDELKQGKSAVEVIFTELHSGGKFDKRAYSFSGGLHGIGLSAVNALAEHLIAQIFRDGKEYRIEFREGKLSVALYEAGYSDRRGTIVSFKPCAKIFSNCKPDVKTIEERIKYISYLNEGLKIRVVEEGEGREAFYAFSGGIGGLLESRVGERATVLQKPITASDKGEGYIINVVFNWLEEGSGEEFYCFTNNIRQIDGGSHFNGLKTGVSRCLQETIASLRLNNTKKDGFSVTLNDIREGIIAVIDLKLAEPKFASQTKEKLISNRAREVCEQIGYNSVKEFASSHTEEIKILCNKIINSALLRVTTQKLKEQNSKKQKQFTALMHGGNFVDCKEKDLEVREIFLVEGVSAAGTAKQARDRNNQAIYVLRGKVLNVEKANLAKMLNSKTLRGLVSAVGGEFQSDGTLLWKPKFGKIVIMVDADIDGSHIAALLLIFFFKYLRQAIMDGFVYVANPPLYRLMDKGQIHYFSTNEELNFYLFGRKPSPLYSVCDILSKAESLMKVTGIHEIGVLDCMVQGLCEEQSMDLWRLIPYFSNFDMYEVRHSGDNVYFEHRVTKRNFVLDRDFIVKPEYKVFCSSVLDKAHEIRALTQNIASQNITTQNLVSHLALEKEQCARGIIYHRNKGLGELNPIQLKQTGMDPVTRKIKKVYINDLEEALAKCEIFAGKDVKKRKKEILTYGMGADIDV